MESVLTAFAVQAHVQILYTPGLVAGRQSPGLSGAFTAYDALTRLLAGSGLVAHETRPGVIVLRSKAVSASDAQPVATATADPTTLTEVVVTGTHIRGADAGPSPLLQFDRGEIDRQGYATVADTLQALPQNYSGLATPDVTATGFDSSSANYAKATGVNLRGLGPDATLVMINGRRMAGTGGKGDFADVSSIPTAAVDRVDVLLDGASALYGSDAVGGVVNIILKRDFDGAETRARYGAAKGGAAETVLAQTFGRVWSTGHALASYEYDDREALPFSARAYTVSADLRPFGGSDRRVINASPGNVLIADPVTNALVPTFAIPAGATVFPLKPSDFQRGVVNLQTARQGMDLLPHQERHSVYAALTQTLDDRVEVTADLRFSRRTADSNSLAPTATVTIADNNPYFASPNGARSQQIAYSFFGDLGPTRAFSAAQSLGASVGAKVRLWGDWRADTYGAFAQERISAGTNGNLNSLFLREAVGATADNPATPFRTSVDGFFNPYGTGNANNPAVLDFIGGGYSRQNFTNEVRSFNLEADGKVLPLPGGDLRLAVGAHTRLERFEQRTVNLLSTVSPVVTIPADEKRTVTAAFAELRAPLVGPGNARPGVRSLELSLAVRAERYSDAGSTANPKIGLTWEPITGLRLRSTYGTSFRAPGLTEINLTPTISAVTFTRAGARVQALDVDGGNPGLKPETATSWTAGFDLAPLALPGLKIAATLFDTDFTDQIDRPVFRFIASGIDNPVIAPFVQAINPANPADLAKVQALLNDPTYTTPGLFPANAFAAIVDTRYVNTGRLHVRGIDASAAYGFDRGRDHFELSANGTYLIHYEQQLTPTAATGDFVGIAGQPVNLRARAALSWRREAFGATLGVNHVGAYKSEVGKRIDAWTTADLQLRWTPDTPPLEGLALAVSVQNLLDTEPPFYNSPQGVGYDAANADPLGRYASVQLTKRW